MLCSQFQSSSPAEVQPSGDEEQEDAAVAWVNAAVGRIFWDFLTEPHWAQLVSKKIQMKLSKIRVSGGRRCFTLTTGTVPEKCTVCTSRVGQDQPPRPSRASVSCSCPIS